MWLNFIAMNIYMNAILPKELSTPVIPLGIPIEEGLKILATIGAPEIEKDKQEISYRVNTPEFDVAIYEKEGAVKSVWYNDPLGCIWMFGKKRNEHSHGVRSCNATK